MVHGFGAHDWQRYIALSPMAMERSLNHRSWSANVVYDSWEVISGGYFSQSWVFDKRSMVEIINSKDKQSSVSQFGCK